jgi:hypothetical protein
VAFAVDGPTKTQTIGVTVPTLRLAGVTSAANIEIVAPTVAGQAPLDANSDAVTYLRFTCIQTATGIKTGVDVHASGIPAGTYLGLAASAPNSDAMGVLPGAGAYFAFPVTTGHTGLPTSDQPLVEALGSSYSGSGDSDGIGLVYTLHIYDWTAVRAGTTHPLVTFTMRDSN